MDDEKIIALYHRRNEMAIRETKTKYGRYIQTIAHNILQNREDAEECENDTYLGAWESMPPERPHALAPFLGTLARRIALDKWRRRHADKRGGGETTLPLCELEECIPDASSIDDSITAATIAESISAFLRTLPEAECSVFLRRYWYCDSIRAICLRYGYSQSKVKMSLLRTREKLCKLLEKEGILL